MDAKAYAKNAGDIFVLPEAVVKIKQLIDDSTTSMHEIAEVINYDPAIMSQVLKISNSALYKFPNTITTVSKAIQVIGTKSVYDLVLAYGVANAFKDINPDVIDLERFWERAVSCGLLAKHFAEELNIKEPERLFVCGLLHNIGELVLVSLDPEKARLCANIDEKTRPVTLELNCLGFTYADIARELLSLWGLPVGIYGPFRAMHASLKPATEREEQILQLSYVLAINNVYKEFYAPLTEVSESLYEPLGFDIDQVNAALDFTNLQLISAMSIFSPSSFSMY
jgi:HD-like signal output (HDOD) protein